MKFAEISKKNHQTNEELILCILSYAKSASVSISEFYAFSFPEDEKI